MTEIEFRTDAYVAARSALTEGAATLATAGGELGSAVSAMALGPLGAFVPPIFNTLGSAFDHAASAAGSIAERTATGIDQAVEILQAVEDAAAADLNQLSSESR